MARTRNLKPGFFTSDQLAECSFPARLLFAGLWVVSDREGRLEDRPKKIKAEVFPHDALDVDALLNDLVAQKLILRYSIGEDKYIQVLTFKQHQNPHIKEAGSSIPAPDMPGTSTGQAPDEPGLLPSSFSLPPSPNHLVLPLEEDLKTIPPVSAPPSGVAEAKPADFSESEKPKMKRGSRLDAHLKATFDSEDTPQAWGEWAFAPKQGLTVEEIRFAWEEFVDYWRGVPGQKGCKLDWEGTWRNRCRVAIKDKKRKEELNGLYARKRA